MSSRTRLPAVTTLVVMLHLSGCGNPETSETAPDASAQDASASIASANESAASQNSADASQLTDEEIAAGWISLFDGATLFGWTPTSNANWEVQDGTIKVSAGEPGFLRSNSEFGDFELMLEFKSDLGTNSGVFLHTLEMPKDPSTDCYELNIADVGVSPFPTGSFVGRAKASGDEAAQQARDKAEWQTFHVVSQDGTYTVDLDGERVLDYTDPTPLRRGNILLQLNSGAVAFRNIKLKPLGLQEMMTAATFEASWSKAETQDADFSFADGRLEITGGPGQLESRQSFGDFVLQTEVIVNGDGLNSGIFFRNIPGSVMQGYESQIHNGFRDNDRTKPVDAGTGAIFRRQPARRVMADDHTWFSKTLICSGNHMAVWVNGYQVTDWTDDRDAHENPRQGRRLEPGTFALQAHDPTTDLAFRNFKAGELPPRPDAATAQ